MMNLQRLWNSTVPGPVRRHVHLSWFLFVCILFCIIYFGQDLFRFAPDICQSQVNLNSEVLNVSGIHVIPSVPRKRGSYQAISDSEIDGSFYPYDNECVDIYTPGEHNTIMICIHDPKKDMMVSAHLKNEGAWEGENVEALYNAHQKHPDMVLVDLGCNIGVFTLPAAKFGMEVIAVDAMMASLTLLQRSLFLNGLSCHVTLIRNALYRKHIQLRVNVDPTNIGGSTVSEIVESRRDNIPKSHLVDAICLDDLVPMVKGKKVFLKLDLEGNEAAVLECAEKFFKEVDIKVLLIEWMYFRHNDKESGFIKEFLMKHKLVPTWGIDLDRFIDPYASNSWPDNVFWMKKD